MLRLCPATQRATAHCPATAWWGPTASAAWRAQCMTGPSAPPPPPPSLQRRRGGRWGTTPCGSCMSGSRGRPSPGKVWLSQQVHIYPTDMLPVLEQEVIGYSLEYTHLVLAKKVRQCFEFLTCDVLNLKHFFKAYRSHFYVLHCLTVKAMGDWKLVWIVNQAIWDPQLIFPQHTVFQQQ